MSLVRTRVEIIDSRTLTIKGLEGQTREAFQETNKRAFRKLSPKMLKSFQEYPESPSGKFVWSENPSNDAKARAWWFMYLRATLQFGKNTRYIRTNTLKNSWFVNIIIQDDVGGFTVGSKAVGQNPLSKNLGKFQYKWVVGTFAEKSGGAQIPSHRNRWFKAIDKARFWQGEYVDEFQKEYPSILAQIRNR